MLILLAKFQTKMDSMNEMIKHAEKMVELSNKEEGCISYEFYQNTINKNSFIFVEKWRSQNDLDLHFKEQYFKEFSEKLPEILDGEGSITTYEVINEKQIT